MAGTSYIADEFLLLCLHFPRAGIPGVYTQLSLWGLGDHTSLRLGKLSVDLPPSPTPTFRGAVESLYRIAHGLALFLKL